MKYFWTIIALAYLLLAIASYFYNRSIDNKFLKAKEDFKKNYGFPTYGILELLVKYTSLATWISVIGGLLASGAAIVSFLSSN